MHYEQPEDQPADSEEEPLGRDERGGQREQGGRGINLKTAIDRPQKA
jgi:hypothetical protein